jgi:hypothetical protein
MTKQRKRQEAVDRRHDSTVEDSFPASDPPAHSGVVGPRRPDVHQSRASHQRDDDARPKGCHATETAFVWEHEETPKHDC